jgi:bacterioferritin-associated ferredoxin
MIVCSCNVLSDRDVRATIADSARRPRMSQVYASLGCSAKCGRCAPAVKRMMDESWTSPDGLEADRCANAMPAVVLGAATEVHMHGTQWFPVFADLPHRSHRGETGASPGQRACQTGCSECGQHGRPAALAAGSTYPTGRGAASPLYGRGDSIGEAA